MRIDPIRTPLPGEGIVGISPALDPTPVADWHRRLNLHTGRALNHDGLTSEQDGRAGRLALLTQALSPGVIDGLSVAIEHDVPPSADADPIPMLHLGAGLGTTAQGEDVVVLRNHRMGLSDIPVYVRSDLVPGDAPEVGSSAGLFARRVGPSLAELRAAGIVLPPVFVVVLQPIQGREIGEFDPDDPCELDTENFAFEDWRRTDGCRVLLHEWPSEWLPLPPPDEQWRNRIAHAIFEREQQLLPNELMPWQALGVPVAVLACDPNGAPLFVDRAAVVRAGGKPKLRTRLPWHSGSPFLWQARVEQLAEQLAEPENASLPPGELARQLRYLPPVGLLPRSAIDARERVNSFFPASYQVEAAPVPLEQLDLALEASASLAPYDIANADAVSVLVPVPQEWFEPNLLREEEVADEFAAAIERFVNERATWLQRRQDVRTKAVALGEAIRGKGPEFPDDDQALEPETVGTGPLEDAEQEYGTKLNDDRTLGVELLQTLAKALEAGPVSESEMRILGDDGIEGFIAAIEKNLQAADKAVDIGFMRVQSDIYRLRQLVLGSAAGRLTVSPALASIARAQTAPATRVQLDTFLSVLQKVPVKVDEEESTPPGSGGTRAFALHADARNARASNMAGRQGGAATKIGRTEFLAAPQPNIAAAAMANVLVKPHSGALTPARAEEVFRPSLPRPEAQPPPPAPLPAPPTPIDVTAQPPVAGLAEIRTTSIAERIKSPEAVEARGFCIATRHDVVAQLVKLPISLDGLELTGLVGPEDLKLESPTRTKTMLLTDLLSGKEKLDDLLKDPLPKNKNADVGAYFSVGVDITDHTIAVLRVVEGRIAAYREALDDCREALAKLYRFEAKVAVRLQQIERELAESRHDVAVARALLAEETQRVAAINARRDRIIAEHVTFLAYQRPRSSDLLEMLPSRPIDPGPTESAVPACLGANHDAPPELDALIDLVRGAPAKWFVPVAALIERLDRLEALQQALLAAQLRAQYYSYLPLLPTAGLGRFAASIHQVIGAQLNVISFHRQAASMVDLSRLAGAGWRPTRARCSRSGTSSTVRMGAATWLGSRPANWRMLRGLPPACMPSWARCCRRSDSNGPSVSVSTMGTSICVP